MKKLFILLFMLGGIVCSAQDIAALAKATEAKRSGNELEKYRRSSLYSVLVKHSKEKYGLEIDSAFNAMPIPDRFNDHNLPLRSFESSATKAVKSGNIKDQFNLEDISAFIDLSHAANNMVAKWFNRDSTGAFNVDLVRDRGYYDASADDIAAAKLTERNLSILGDAGEDLIGKTFMIVNDITFVDKGENSAKAAGVIKVLGSVAGLLLNSSAVTDLGNLAAAATNEIDGFTVNITTYLYQLAWDENIAGEFYATMWMDSTSVDSVRRACFDTSSLFKLNYVGKTMTSAANLSSKSFSKFTKSAQMLKVCARAVDKAIVQLSRSYEQFRVKVPIGQISEDGKSVEVAIGLKDGVSVKNKYEVLMPAKDADGKVTYKRVGTLQPIKGQIWDNRFGALDDAQALAESHEKVKDDEGAEGNPMLLATTFKVLSGAGQIAPGCLVREMEIKK